MGCHYPEKEYRLKVTRCRSAHRLRDGTQLTPPPPASRPCAGCCCHSWNVAHTHCAKRHIVQNVTLCRAYLVAHACALLGKGTNPEDLSAPHPATEQHQACVLCCSLLPQSCSNSTFGRLRYHRQHILGHRDTCKTIQPTTQDRAGWYASCVCMYAEPDQNNPSVQLQPIASAPSQANEE
jgi:hypothetical protein